MSVSESPDAVVGEMNEESGSGCPVADGRAPHPTQGGGNRGWWPNRLNLKILAKNPPVANPLGEEFDYAEAFETLDLPAVKQDIEDVLTTSQDWWPADYGHYGPFIIRMAWHSAGTYRISDGRGGAGAGQQRFAPLNSWPDNANLDKARRLLWPVKKKYGQKLSWADLMVLAGNVALESMGFKTFGFGGGREDVWEPDEDVYWGPETTWLGDERYTGDRELENPLAAVQMGLIYVNPEGPNGNPDPLAAAMDIRETFRRMAMNDEETVALIAGGHTFGKTHGAADPRPVRRPRARGRSARGAGPRLEEQLRHRQGPGHDHQRPRGHLDDHADAVEQQLLRDPLRLRVGAVRRARPARTSGSRRTARARHRPRRPRRLEEAAPDDADDGPRAAVRPGLRADLAALPRAPGRARGRLRPRLVQADAPRHGAGRALPRARRSRPRRCSGRTRSQPSTTNSSAAEDVAALKGQILASGLSVSQLVSTAWASASTFRGSDKRGGANGARIRLEPQNGWEVNDPDELATVLRSLEGIQEAFNASQAGGKKVSLADLIVLGGSAAVEQAAKNAGHDVEVPFTPGRTDASQEQTDVESFAALEPTADGFRNYLGQRTTGCRPSTSCSTGRTC